MSANRVYSVAAGAMRDRPLFLQAVGGDAAISYSAQDFRLGMAASFPGGGYVTGSALKVSQRAAGANLSVDIAAGTYFVKGDSVSAEGVYQVILTSTVNLLMPAVPVATRTHRIVVGVANKETAGGSIYEGYVDYLEDTGAGLPALGATQESLATVTMTSGMASITNANITDLRVAATDTGQVVNVASYVVGDGITDDAAAISAAVTDLPSGGVLYFPPGLRCLANSSVTLNKACRVIGYRAQIFTSSITNKQIVIAASDVTIEGLRVTGANYSVYSGTSAGIYIFAPSWVDAYERIRVHRVHVDNQPFACVYAKWIKNLVVTDSLIENYVYLGVMGLSVQGARVSGCRIRNASRLTAPQAYGIAFSRWSLDTIALSPKSKDISVIDNDLEDIPWEAIDSHAADSMLIMGNRIRRCLVGIAMVPCPGSTADGETAIDVWSPNDCQIIGNHIDGEYTDGRQQSGIKIVGCGNTNQADYYAQGCQIIGNTIRRMGAGKVTQLDVDYATANPPMTVPVLGEGTDSAALQGGIQIYYTRGIVISGNQIIEPSPFGITLHLRNYDAIVVNNAIFDPWSPATGAPTYGTAAAAGIAIRSADNLNVILAGNKLIRAAKSAAYVLPRGLYISTTTNVYWIDGGGNDFSAATTPFSGGTSVSKLSFHVASPMLKPTITGSRGGNAALASLLTQLAAYGLITDSTTA